MDTALIVDDDDYISKPYKQEILIKIVKKYNASAP